MVFLQKSAYFRGFIELLTPTIMGQKTRLEELYELARQHDLVNSKGEFATLIGMDGASLSHAFKDDGRVSTANAILRAEHALMRAGVSCSPLPMATARCTISMAIKIKMGFHRRLSIALLPRWQRSARRTTVRWSRRTLRLTVCFRCSKNCKTNSVWKRITTMG